ncbi:MAG TPA: hypothetical protein VE377_14915 [Candidatus Dormibacteraeota bacterium]|nr:hypothetical protein [Candidatus Dormibacteraeota bacterium]
MEILIALLIIGLVIALGRMWSTATQESAAGPTSANTAPAYFSSNNAGTDWLLYEQTQSTVDAGSSDAAVSDAPAADSQEQPQDCSQNSDSGYDCPCPADSTSYDTSGCGANSSSSSGGDSN